MRDAAVLEIPARSPLQARGAGLRRRSVLRSQSWHFLTGPASALAIIEGNLRKAKRYLDAAAAFCEQASMRLELVTIYRELARVAALGRRFKEATAYGERAFAVMRTMRVHDAAAALRMTGVVARA